MEIDSPIKLREWITNSDWHDFFEKQTRLPYWKKLENFLQQEIQQGKTVYPPHKNISCFQRSFPKKNKGYYSRTRPLSPKRASRWFCFLGKHSQPTIATKLTKYLQRNFTNKKTAI